VSQLEIRPYQPGDRQAVHTIGADSAFFGDAVEAQMEDRRLFCDLFLAYYTDLEPEHAWVACQDDRVTGFLLGCLDGRQQRKALLWSIVPRVLGRLPHRGYRLGRRTWRFAGAMVGAWLRGEVPPSFSDRYPAHLHLNVAAPWRGRGVGRRLLEAYLAQLRALAVPGVHLHTTSRNEAACRLYERVGFRLLEQRPTRLWAGLLDSPVQSRCYGLQL
jgi:ribosomal protein S18 acetylase RimI-like enzyme